jgi:AcrR family transcriptional regulator
VTTRAEQTGAETPAKARPGRPVDHSLDDAVLATTLDLIAENPLEGITLDAVAARTGRAKTTLYRRWATKDALVVAAVRSMGRPPEAEHPPRRGSLRADMLAVVDSPWLGGTARRLALFAGLATTASHVTGLDAVVRTEITEPYVEIYRRLLTRAIDEDEAPEELRSRVDTLAAVIPAMSSHRFGLDHTTMRRDFFVAVVDDVVLAAVRGTRASA